MLTKLPSSTSLRRDPTSPYYRHASVQMLRFDSLPANLRQLIRDHPRELTINLSGHLSIRTAHRSQP